MSSRAGGRPEATVVGRRSASSPGGGRVDLGHHVRARRTRLELRDDGVPLLAVGGVGEVSLEPAPSWTMTSTPDPERRPATSGMIATRRSPAHVSVGTASFTGGHQSTSGCRGSTPWAACAAPEAPSRAPSPAGCQAPRRALRKAGASPPPRVTSRAAPRHVRRRGRGQEQAGAGDVLGGSHPAQGHRGRHHGQAGHPAVVVLGGLGGDHPGHHAVDTDLGRPFDGQGTGEADEPRLRRAVGGGAGRGA